MCYHADFGRSALKGEEEEEEEEEFILQTCIQN